MSYLPEDNTKREILEVFNFATNTVGDRTPYALIDRLVQRVWDDPTVAEALQDMYTGSLSQAALSYPTDASRFPSHPDPRSSSVNIDIAQIEKISSMHALPIDDYMYPLRNPDATPDKPHGIYYMPSFCDHSCLPSASTVYFGDVLVLRAARDLKAGDAVTIGCYPWYKPNTGIVGNVSRTWNGVVCTCPLCKADKADGREFVQTRHLGRLGPPIGSLLRARQGLAETKATYKDTPWRKACDVKLALASAYFQVAAALSKFKMNYGGGTSVYRDGVECAEAYMDGLQAIGMVITDRGTSGKPVSPSTLPVDTSKPPAFLHTCGLKVVQLAFTLDRIGEPERASHWLRVGVWGKYLYLSSRPRNLD